MRVADLDHDDMRRITKQAIKEWLTENFENFKGWSFSLLVAVAFTLIVLWFMSGVKWK